MRDPVDERTESAAAGAPVLKLLESFAPEASRAGYDEWTRHPVTRLVEAALSEMALRPPVRPDDVAVQYGVTVGLGIAAQLLRSPETVFPAMFAGRPGMTMPSETFETSPDDTL